MQINPCKFYCSALKAVSHSLWETTTRRWLHVHSSAPPDEPYNDTQTHTLLYSPIQLHCPSKLLWQRAAIAGDRPYLVMAQIMWPQNGGSSELFCELSISTERLETGTRQGTWKHTHALRSARTETPEPLQWWVNGLYSVEIKVRKWGMCAFFPPHTIRRQEARVREGLLSSAQVVVNVKQLSILHGGWTYQLILLFLFCSVLHWCVSANACYLCMHVFL